MLFPMLLILISLKAPHSSGAYKNLDKTARPAIL